MRQLVRTEANLLLRQTQVIPNLFQGGLPKQIFYRYCVMNMELSLVLNKWVVHSDDYVYYRTATLCKTKQRRLVEQILQALY